MRGRHSSANMSTTKYRCLGCKVSISSPSSDWRTLSLYTLANFLCMRRVALTRLSARKAGRLVKRKGNFGTFLGCSRYPGCKNTEKVETYCGALVRLQLFTRHPLAPLHGAATHSLPHALRSHCAGCTAVGPTVEDEAGSQPPQQQPAATTRPPQTPAQQNGIFFAPVRSSAPIWAVCSRWPLANQALARLDRRPWTRHPAAVVHQPAPRRHGTACLASVT